MKRKKIQYNEINDDVYQNEKIRKSKFIIVGIIFLFIGFFIHFNLSERIDQFLKPILISNARCPIKYDKSEVEYFIPKLNLKNVVISGQCFQSPYQKLSFKNVSLTLVGPSFVPIGFKFKVSIQDTLHKIHLYPSLSFSKQVIEILDTELDGDIFKVLLGANETPLRGKIKIQGVFHITNQKINEGKLLIESQNLLLPEQNIKGFLSPTLNLKILKLNLRILKNQTIDVREFILGNGNPVGLNLKGSILLNSQMIGSSEVNLDGTLKTTPFFLESFALLKLLLPANPNPAGEFRIKFQNTLSNLAEPQITNPN